MAQQAPSLPLELPSWFKGRQAKADEMGPGSYKLSGPNLPEAVISVRLTDDLTWQAVLRAKLDGPEVAVSRPNVPTAREALQVAFEMYRTHFVN